MSNTFAAAVRVAAAAFIWAAGLAAHAADPIPERIVQRMLLVDAARVGDRVVAVGEHGYVVASDDFGATWRFAYDQPNAPLLTSIAFQDKSVGFAVGHDALVLRTADGGTSWKQVYAAAQEQRPLLDVIAIDEHLAIAVGAYGLYLESADAGETWTPRKIIQDDKHLNAIVRLGGRLVIVGEAGTVLASDDRGKTWQPLASPYKGSFFGAVAADEGGIVICGLRGRIFRSADRGATWTAVDNASTMALMGGTKLADGTIVLVGSAGTVLASRDGGRAFVPVMTGSTRALSAAVAGAADKLMLFGEGGERDVSLPFKRATP
jgi:photosystem II stability/assembly factor-like uncharacterized protein